MSKVASVNEKQVIDQNVLVCSACLQSPPDVTFRTKYSVNSRNIDRYKKYFGEHMKEGKLCDKCYRIWYTSSKKRTSLNKSNSVSSSKNISNESKQESTNVTANINQITEGKRKRKRTQISEEAEDQEEHVVVCTCDNPNEDGLMVQCDSCHFWLHGHCLSFYTPESVPNKYICNMCKLSNKKRTPKKDKSKKKKTNKRTPRSKTKDLLGNAVLKAEANGTYLKIKVENPNQESSTEKSVKEPRKPKPSKSYSKKDEIDEFVYPIFDDELEIDETNDYQNDVEYFCKNGESTIEIFKNGHFNFQVKFCSLNKFSSF